MTDEHEPQAASEGIVGQSASTGELGWCPTRSGNYTAYEPQWFDGNEWKRVHTVINHYGEGLPQPALCGGINIELFLFGYEQAMALAWGFAAHAEAQNKHIKVRVMGYEVVYDLKARRNTETDFQ